MIKGLMNWRKKDNDLKFTLSFGLESFIFGALSVKLGKFSLKPKQSKGKRLYTLNFIMGQIWLGALKLALF